MLVISTQYRENYGTPEAPYWKNKGGSCYKVINAPSGMHPFEIVAACGIEYSNEYSSEHAIGTFWADDEWLSEFERQQLEYDGEIRYPEPLIDFNEIKETA